MGVNDAANIAAGSNVGALERMRRMMSVIGSQPALWVAVRTLVASGPYADTHMQSWNTSLLQMCAAHPNMRVFNWAGEVQPAYYIPDGIHYNTPGSAILAAALADGLARAFPATRPSPASCLVP
jgi:lysophospholipase L1-like esterase